MSLLASGAFALGTAIMKTACGLWLGNVKFLENLSADVIDEAAARLRTAKETRQFRRVLEQAAERVADRIERVPSSVPDGDRLAVLGFVTETFERAALTDADLFKADLDAGYLYRHLLIEPEPERWGLSEAGSAFHRLLLRECCGYLIEVVRTLPGSGMLALEELLRRDTQILAELEQVLDRLPARRGERDFEADYRQLVGNRLDRIEFFGATLSEASRRYPLSVAYLSLTVSGELLNRKPAASGWVHGDEPSGHDADPGTARAETALANSDRLFIRGQAGIGKTTLLQWIAVQSARSSFSGQLTGWQNTVPFFLPLRRYAARALPRPAEFLTEVGQHIADELPPGWVQAQLRSGRAVVLIDGVDELTEDRRDEARAWLSELVESFPRARYVVTSRPAAVPEDWLGEARFDVAELEPMSPGDVRVFVARWHDAIRDAAPDPEVRAELDEYQENFLAALDAKSHLRRLSAYPLLCALLCALHRDRRAQLPDNRMELYEVALHMLLERRDSERRIPSEIRLSRTQKTLLLQELAYWLIRNGWTDASKADATDRIAAKLAGLTSLPQSPTIGPEVLRHLLERSGLLREPVDGRIDFVHRTFQEYLAARAAVDADDLGVLINHAHLDQWREVIVLSTGHASAGWRTRLLRGLIEHAYAGPKVRCHTVLLLVIACLDTSPDLPPDLRAAIEKEAQGLLPPRNMAMAAALAGAGDSALDLLARSEPTTPKEIAATIRAAAATRDPAAVELIARFRDRPERIVARELVAAWKEFDPEEYARRVLVDQPFHHRWQDGVVRIEDPRFIAGLRHLRNMTSLTCHFWNHNVADLAFLQELTRLDDLSLFSVAADLSPARHLGLSRLFINNDAEQPPIDLTPVDEMPSLEDVALFAPVSQLSRLTRLPVLRDLTLRAAPLAELADLRALTQLRSLLLHDIDELIDIEPLNFLTEPAQLGFFGCGSLRNISGLLRWRSSLRSLSLDSTADADLSVLPQMDHVSYLQLGRDTRPDLSAVARMPVLRMLAMPAVDLRPLAATSALTHLWLYSQGAEVNLTPLAGYRNLTVVVDRSATVRGADALGDGSRMKRGFV